MVKSEALTKLPDLRLLSQYMVISNAPSMRAASARLGISPAAVSQAIARLEREFGVALLERGARGTRLTPAGSVLRHQSAILLESAVDLVDSLDLCRTKTLPRLRMYVMDSVARILFPTLVTSLTNIVGDLTILSSRRHDSQELVSGIWDILISSDDLSGIPNIESHPIFCERLVALVPRQMLEEESDLQGVARHVPYLRYNRTRRLYDLAMRYIQDGNIEPPRQIDCPSTGAMLDLVAGGLGWAISTPLMLCRLRPLRERIAWVLLPTAYHRKIYVSFDRNRLPDLPESLAQKCRRTLVEEIETWPEVLAPEAREAVEVLGQPGSSSAETA